MQKRLTIKTQHGLGDALYCYPIVKFFHSQQPIKVVTKYPIIFKFLQIPTSIRYNQTADIEPTYANLRHSKDNQYIDTLNSIGLPFMPFEFDWPYNFTNDFWPIFRKIVDFAEHYGKKICVIKEPHVNKMLQRTNDKSLTANANEMQKFIDMNKNDYTFVSVGHSEKFTARLKDIDFDINNKTSIHNLITLCKYSDGIATQSGNLVPLAQVFKKPLKIFMADRITDSRLKNYGVHKLRLENDIQLV